MDPWSLKPPSYTLHLSDSLCSPKMTLNFSRHSASGLYLLFYVELGMESKASCKLGKSSVSGAPSTFSQGHVTAEGVVCLPGGLAILEHVARLDFRANSVLSSQLISKRKADGWCFSFYTSAQGTLQKGCTDMGLRARAWEGGTILVPSSQWLASPECEERTGHLHWHSEPEDTATLLPYPVF